MKQEIQKQYSNLILNSGDFRAFVEKMDKYSTDEIIALYDAKKDIISCLAVLSEMQS